MTADARQGLAAFAAQPFDVVLTDLGLPGVSGEEVARTIHHSSPQTPVVMLTGWSCQLNANGQKIEGQGVIPNHLVPLTIADLRASRDRALETAQEVLSTLAATKPRG